MKIVSQLRDHKTPKLLWVETTQFKSLQEKVTWINTLLTSDTWLSTSNWRTESRRTNKHKQWYLEPHNHCKTQSKLYSLHQGQQNNRQISKVSNAWSHKSCNHKVFGTYFYMAKTKLTVSISAKSESLII